LSIVAAVMLLVVSSASSAGRRAATGDDGERSGAVIAVSEQRSAPNVGLEQCVRFRGYLASTRIEFVDPGANAAVDFAGEPLKNRTSRF
jgi:hypothetical protein